MLRVEDSSTGVWDNLRGELELEDEAIDLVDAESNRDVLLAGQLHNPLRVEHHPGKEGSRLRAWGLIFAGHCRYGTFNDSEQRVWDLELRVWN